MACMAIWIAACRMQGCSWALVDGCQLSCTLTMLSCCPGTASGLQGLLDSMHAFCLGLGLTISPSKTEVVVFNGSSCDTWHVGQHVLPRSASFKYLGIVFHESGSMTEALARLLQNGKGAAARLAAKHKALMCDKSFPMMRRLFDAVVRPTVSYGCKVWAPACSPALVPQLKDMQNIQLSFFRNLCHLRKSVMPHIVFREFAERPWLDSWWSMVLRFHAPIVAFCPRAACIWTFCKTTLQMPGSRWCAPIGLRVLTGSSGTWAWALLSSPLGLGL